MGTIQSKIVHFPPITLFTALPAVQSSTSTAVSRSMTVAIMALVGYLEEIWCCFNYRCGGEFFKECRYVEGTGTGGILISVDNAVKTIINSQCVSVCECVCVHVSVIGCIILLCNSLQSNLV